MTFTKTGISVIYIYMYTSFPKHSGKKKHMCTHVHSTTIQQQKVFDSDLVLLAFSGLPDNQTMNKLLTTVTLEEVI